MGPNRWVGYDITRVVLTLPRYQHSKHDDNNHCENEGDSPDRKTFHWEEAFRKGILDYKITMDAYVLSERAKIQRINIRTSH
jgi:hypothetical protein